jgi:cytochrome c556
MAEIPSRSEPWSKQNVMRLPCYVLSTVVLASFSAQSRADDQEVIDYRQHIMKSMGEQAKIIDMIVNKRAPASDLAKHIQILATTAPMAKSAFELEVHGGESKPEVWTKWDDFAKRLDAMTAATADLAKVAQSGGLAAVTPKLQSALDCKGCHDTYRVPK